MNEMIVTFREELQMCTGGELALRPNQVATVYSHE